MNMLTYGRVSLSLFSTSLVLCSEEVLVSHFYFGRFSFYFFALSVFSLDVLKAYKLQNLKFRFLLIWWSYLLSEMSRSNDQFRSLTVIWTAAKQGTKFGLSLETNRLNSIESSEMTIRIIQWTTLWSGSLFSNIIAKPSIRFDFTQT